MKPLAAPRAIAAEQIKGATRAPARDAKHSAGLAPDTRPGVSLAAGPAQRRAGRTRNANTRGLRRKTGQVSVVAFAGWRSFLAVLSPSLDRHDV
jgi:hypothetical protein